MSDETPRDSQRHGLLHAAVDAFVESTRAVAGLVGTAGGTALHALPEPAPESIQKMLASLEQMAEQMPPLTAEFEVFVEEIRAKRLSIQALQAELSAFDRQLDVLERSLAPLEAWTHQWNRVRASLAEALHPPR